MACAICDMLSAISQMPNAISELAAQYASHFKEPLRPLRLVGRELEFPLVEADGSAGDVRRLWPRLMQNGDFKPRYDDPQTQSLIVALNGEEVVYEAEVGLGTIEMLTPACEDLFQLEASVRKG